MTQSSADERVAESIERVRKALEQSSPKMKKISTVRPFMKTIRTSSNNVLNGDIQASLIRLQPNSVQIKFDKVLKKIGKNIVAEKFKYKRHGMGQIAGIAKNYGTSTSTVKLVKRNGSVVDMNVLESLNASQNSIVNTLQQSSEKALEGQSVVDGSSNVDIKTFINQEIKRLQDDLSKGKAITFQQNELTQLTRSTQKK